MGDSTSAEDVVTRFCECWERRDVDELMAFFTDDAIYHNVPLEPSVGRDAIRATIEMLNGMAGEVRFEIVRQVASGNVVINERIDHLSIGDRTVPLPVAGVFEVRDGLISLWRDYFDMATLMGG